MTASLERDSAAEAEILAGRVPQPLRRASAELIASAHERALPGPVLLGDDRDFAREIREELADAANYAAWAVRAGQLRRSDGERLCRVLAEAWHILRS